MKKGFFLVSCEFIICFFLDGSNKGLEMSETDPERYSDDVTDNIVDIDAPIGVNSEDSIHERTNTDKNDSEDTDNNEDEEDDDEEDDEEETEEEADEEEEEPPMLKYKRINKLPVRFFDKDPVSTAHVSHNIQFFATHSGILLICNLNFETIKFFKAHTASILSIDFDGTHFATCSMDGTVLIGLINKNNEVLDSDLVKYDFKRPIYSVALDKPYNLKKSFFCGGTSGELIYSSKSWLGQRNDQILDKNGECITMIKSLNDLIIWCNSKGIIIYQISNKKQLLKIDVPPGLSRPELYWPKIQFIENDKILIGWVNYVWYLKIENDVNNSKNNDNDKLNNNDNINSFVSNNTNNTGGVLSNAASSFKMSIYAEEQKTVEILYERRLDDCFIAGISEYFNNDLMILNYLPKLSKNQYFAPELKIYDSITFEELSVDELNIKNFEGLGMNDYQLIEINNYENDEFKGTKWYLISSNDAIIIEEFNLNDKLSWYLTKGRYHEAWELGGYWLNKFEKLKIGEEQLNIYLKANKWDSLCAFLIQVLKLENYHDYQGDDKFIQKIINDWNKYLNEFLNENKLFENSEILPIDKFETTEEDNQIDKQFYELILHNYLNIKDIDKFEEYLKKWDHALFDLKDIQLHLNEILESKDFEGLDDITINNLRRLYIEISLELDEPANCVKELINLKDEKLMEFLDEHHLIDSYLNELPNIITLGVNKEDLNGLNFDKLKDSILYTNINILVENIHEILPEKIIKIFKDSKMEIINYIYLNELNKVDKHLIKNFEDEIILMYAKFDNEKLEEFLNKHKNYSIDNAIEICKKYNKYKELVYLLSKIGENEQALKLIIDKIEDPIKAINFVQNINEKELWDFLLNYSMNKSEFIKELLKNVGSLVDPIPVVSRIPYGVEITDLKEAINNICLNVEIDELILKIILSIINKEFIEKNDEYRIFKSKGYLINELELNEMQEDLNECYLKIGDESIRKEKEVIGHEWKGDKGNKVGHKSYLKFKLS